MYKKIKKEMRDAGLKWRFTDRKMGDDGYRLMVKFPDERTFKRYLNWEDARVRARVGSMLEGEYDLDDVKHAAEQVAVTWNNDTKENDYPRKG